MTHHALREFVTACDAFVAAPARERPMAGMVSARMRLMDKGIPEDANWLPLVRVLVGLATAAQEAGRREERRDAIAEIMRLALNCWRGDLGDHVIAAPKAAPAAIIQYKD